MKNQLLIVLALLFGSTTLAQQLKRDAKADSLLCKEKIALMNSESDVEDDGRLNPNTTTAQVNYAPDNRFKFVVTIGESCGAYCNPYNSAWLYYYTNGKLTGIKYDYFNPIRGIFVVAKTKEYTDYVVLTSNWSRPRGFETGTTYGFIHYRWQNDELTEIKPTFIEPENNYTEIYSSNLLCKEVEGIGMTYNAKTKTINYKLLSYSDENSICQIITGKYTYKKGIFLQAKETITKGKTNVD